MKPNKKVITIKNKSLHLNFIAWHRLWITPLIFLVFSTTHVQTNISNRIVIIKWHHNRAFLLFHFFWPMEKSNLLVWATLSEYATVERVLIRTNAVTWFFFLWNLFFDLVLLIEYWNEKLVTFGFKVGCDFPVVIWSEFCMRAVLYCQYRNVNHQEHTPSLD